MIATSSLSSASSPSSQIFRDKVFRRYSSLPPLRPSRTAHAPRFSASCASAAERAERERTAGSSYYYSRSYSTGSAATSLAVGATLYDVLGLAAGATPQEIKAAYRRLARACHPDVAAAAGRKGASAEEFMRVHAAYATLSDPGKRAEYDRRVMVVMAAAAGCRRRGPPGFSWPPSGSHSSFSTSYYSPPSPASPNPSSPSSIFGRRTWETDQCW